MYNFSSRSIGIPDAGIKSIMQFASQFPDTISLGQGMPLFPTPQFIYEGLLERSKIDEKLGMYLDAKPDTEAMLVDLVIKQIESEYGFSPARSEIVLTIGGIGALFAGLSALIEQGDEIIFFDPSYPLHLSQIHLTQATPIFVRYREEDGWAFDISALSDAITRRTKAILLTNPNNPTGTVLSETDVRELSDLVISNDIILIVDEAYFSLTYDKPIFSPLFVPELRSRIILCRSFSKEFAMTGWRIGYSYAPSDLAKKIYSIHTYFSISPPTPSIVAATLAMSDPRGKNAMDEIVRKITESRMTICNRLDNLSKLFSYHPPQGAFYAFPKYIGFDMQDVEFSKKLIEEAGVITVGGSSMGPSGVGHLRMSFAGNSSIINRAFDRIDEFARKYDLL